MKPQLQLTNAGRSAFTSLTALSIDHFLCGSSFDTNNESIETASPFQFNIHFQKVYVKGEQYEKNGVTVTEGYDHIKIIGYLSSSDITFDDTGEYTVKEIGLMGTLNNQSVCLAYGYNEEGIILYENTNDRYIIKLDIICEQTPNIVINNSTGYVAYNDFLDHIDKRIDGNTPVHGLNIINNRIYINGNPLTIDVEGVSNTKMDNIVGINSEVEVLPTPSSMPVGFIVALKDTGAMYKNIEITENNAPAQAWQPINNLNSQIQLLANQMWFPSWQPNTSYSIGDPVKTVDCKPFEYLECVVAGTTGVTIPSYSNVGQLVTDNEVKWLVCDWRDSAPVGTIKQDLVKRDGWLKLNGATVNVADYPRLVNFLTANSLIQSYTSIVGSTKFKYGDSNNTTLLLPDFEGLFIENSVNNTLSKVNAGLPNITGAISNITSSPIDEGSGDWGLFRFKTYGDLIMQRITSNTDKKGGYNLEFNASKSNSIYGNSKTVQPPAVKLIPVIKY